MMTDDIPMMNIEYVSQMVFRVVDVFWSARIHYCQLGRVKVIWRGMFRHPVAERIRTTEDVLKDVHCNWGRDGRDGGRQGMTWSCDKAALLGNVEDRIMTYMYMSTYYIN